MLARNLENYRVEVGSTCGERYFPTYKLVTRVRPRQVTRNLGSDGTYVRSVGEQENLR